MTYDDRIVKSVPRTTKIVLTCKNHPELRWRTKNIDYIGARTIFFSGELMKDECDCPASDLIIVKPQPESE